MPAGENKFGDKTLVLIDGNALVHRSFHALPPLTTKQGVMVNAVFGFTSILLKVLSDVKPEYIAVTFDKAKKTFRHDRYAEYKATRVKAPQELYDQIPLIKEIVRAFNIPIFEEDGFEADDLIGTLATKNPYATLVVSGDLDVLQLVNGKTRLMTPKQGIKDTMIYDAAAVAQRFGGLHPRQMIDYKALRGDVSDNIPGVKGIGEKTAIALLRAFDTLEALYAFLEKTRELDSKALVAEMERAGYDKAVIKVLKGAMREKLLAGEKMALLSKELATIVCDVPVEFNLDACVTKDFDRQKVVGLLQSYEFRSLVNRVPKFGSGASEDANLGQTRLLPAREKVGANIGHLPLAEMARAAFEIISDEQALQALIKKIEQRGEFAFDTETERLDHVRPVLVGISVSVGVGESVYIPVAHKEGLVGTASAGGVQQIPADRLRALLKPIFENPQIRKIGHNIKYDYVSMLEFEIETQGLYFDTMIAAYLLTSSGRGLSLSELSFQEFGHEMQEITELIGKGTPKNPQKQIGFSEVPIARAAQYSADDADVTMRLYQLYKPKLETLKMLSLLTDLEVPLIPVLARMERAGIKVDSQFLAQLSKEFVGQIAALEQKVYALAGTKFNVNSTQQLSSILFETLKLSHQGIKKTLKGFSTAAGELEKLHGQHPIIEVISQYRELEKLRNTYIDTLPLLIRTDTGRLHTSYNQTIAATGRLSSTDPNLQNIPIRTDVGRQIRKAFVAESGFVLLSLDYSQIELRLAAHIADDKAMKEAFMNNEDVHKATAAQIYNVPLFKVDYDMRRSAKTINFGILYGMSPYGLSQALGISREEAGSIIDAYFVTHAGIKQYMEDIVERGTRLGYVETLLGRKRFIPELRAKNFQLQQLGRRMAINSPIQGTQADIIKMAMIAIDRRLYGDGVMGVTQSAGGATALHLENADVRMLLQVHDELVFEVRKDRVQDVARMCAQEMEHAYELSVPLHVDARVGHNWGEMEPLTIESNTKSGDGDTAK